MSEFWSVHDDTQCTGLDDACCARSFNAWREAEPALVQKIEKTLGRDPWKRVPLARRALLFLLASPAAPLKRARAIESVESWCDEQREQIWSAGLRCLQEHRGATEK